MAALIVLLSTSAYAGIGYLIWRGFRDGDQASDPQLRVLGVSGDLHGLGTWVDVELENDGPSTALVAVGLRRRRRWLRASREVSRRAAPRGLRLRLTDEHAVGAVSAGQTTWFRLDAPAAASGVRIVAAIGTPGRMRLHRVDVPAGAPAAFRTIDPAPCRGPQPSW